MFNFFSKKHLFTATILSCALYMPHSAFAATNTDNTNKSQQEATFSAEDQKIINVMKSYLLEHPEFMLEVQDAFIKKQEIKIKKTQKTVIKDSNNDIFNNKQDIILGNPKASKTIVEFFDYNCGFCRSNAKEILQLIKDNKNIRVILKDLPIMGTNSREAHLIANAFYKIMPEKFPEFFEKLMTSKEPNSKRTVETIAIELGAKKEDLEKYSNAPEIEENFSKNMQLAQKLQINGTPAYIIGDEVFPGAITKETILQKLK